MDEFTQLQEYFRERADDLRSGSYLVPEPLVGGVCWRNVVDVGDPFTFFRNAFERITAASPSPRSNKLSSSDCVYQVFFRTFSSLNGEIGTPLKQIAFLPWLQQRLGVTTIITLPVSVMGRANRKGRRGSPFAVRDPFGVDPSLGDPLLDGIPAVAQYRAFVQACRRLGIRVGSIVPLTTLALDSPLFSRWPELGFWWKAEPHERLFCDSVTATFAPDSPGHAGVPEISEKSRSRFCHPPKPSEVWLELFGDAEYWVADVSRDGRRERLSLANAFPDVLGGTGDTYTWGDVAAVNFRHLNFPTPLGVPRPDLDAPSNTAWQVMPHIVAWRARELGEEIFLVDVSTAVPSGVLAEARRLSELPSDEYSRIVSELGLLPLRDRSCGLPTQIEFIAEELWTFDANGGEYAGVVGPLIFCVAAHTRDRDLLVTSLRYHLHLLGRRRARNVFLAGVANHDTAPPLPELVPLLYLITCLLPGAIPMVFGGVEHFASVVVNREFGFDSNSDLRQWRDTLSDEQLALFNDCPMIWSSLPAVDSRMRTLPDFAEWFAQLLDLRERCESWGLTEYGAWDLLGAGVGFFRGGKGGTLYVVANFDPVSTLECTWPWSEAECLLSWHADTSLERLSQGDQFRLPPESGAVWTTSGPGTWFDARGVQ